jgi:hypothetical protein
VLKNVTNSQQIGTIFKEIGSEPETYRRRSLWTDLGDDKWVPAVRGKNEKEKEKDGAGWLLRGPGGA